MADYKLTNGTEIIRISDGAIIPPDVKNIDYQEYLSWVAAGNTPDPVPEPTLDEQAAAIEASYKLRLDAYKELLVSIIAADGTSQSSRTIDTQNKYNALLNKMNEELEALYIGG